MTQTGIKNIKAEETGFGICKCKGNKRIIINNSKYHYVSLK